MRVTATDCKKAAQPIVDMLNKQHSNREYYYEYDPNYGVIRVNKDGGGISKVLPNNGRNDSNTELMFDNMVRFVEMMQGKR